MRVFKLDEAGLERAARVARGGGVVLYPDGLTYCFGCVPTEPEATRRVRGMLPPGSEPLPLIVSKEELARVLVSFNPLAERMAARFWPGPLTMVLPRRINYPLWVTHGARALPVRVPAWEPARKLASLAGGVLVCIPVEEAGGARALGLGDAVSRVKEFDLALDGGVCEGGLPTVLDLTGEEAWVVRRGKVSIGDIRQALNG